MPERLTGHPAKVMHSVRASSNLAGVSIYVLHQRDSFLDIDIYILQVTSTFECILKCVGPIRAVVHGCINIAKLIESVQVQCSTANSIQRMVIYLCQVLDSGFDFVQVKHLFGYLKASGKVSARRRSIPQKSE